MSVVGAERTVARPRLAGALTASPPGPGPLGLHSTMPDYAPSPLRRAPTAAARLGVATVLVKDESSRLGLPSFKILGASWAVARAIAGRNVAGFDGLRRVAAERRPLTLAAATDGNHGRAVARMARLLGLQARIYVPRGTVPARIAGIESEGATVTVVDGGYDDAVRRSAQDADERCLVISDTSWPGYEDVPVWVIEGYQTIFAEIEAEIARGAVPPPGVVAIPIGVGALAAAAIRHFWTAPRSRPALVGVEPTSAACVLASIEAGELVTLTEPQESMMAGLNCATPSLVAWPLVSAGLDVYTAVDDARVPEAMRLLAADGIVAGETGAAGLAGLLALADAGTPVPPEACVLLLVTEGATDPDNYRRLVEADG
jgi:diaminopropionate ammonia-lyase